MADLKDLFQTADWKTEKHVPAITVSEEIKKGEAIKITVTVGKEIAHPNTTEHHISWMEVYFLADGEKFPYQIGRFEFSAHGASVQGPNTSTVYTPPEVICYLKTEKSGVVFTSAYCNIHGIWQGAQRIDLK